MPDKPADMTCHYNPEQEDTHAGRLLMRAMRITAKWLVCLFVTHINYHGDTTIDFEECLCFVFSKI